MFYSYNKLMYQLNYLSIAILTFCALISCDINSKPTPQAHALTGDSITVDSSTKETVYPLGVQALLTVYPAKITGYANDSLIFADGTKLLFDDKREKDFVERLDNSDVEDMFFDVYDTQGETPKYLQDVGRSRCEALFRKIYGNSAKEVSSKLVRVDWFGQTVSITSECGAADSLRAIAKELEHHPDLRKYLKSAGTFYWRQVRGANRLSAHSYGIAIDINTTYSDYWLWKYPKCSETDKIGYVNRIPKEIVEIFERHGYIWGGRWYHFDTMHFEFRPELHAYTKLKGTQ